MKKKPTIIVCDGNDGAGKTTTIKFLQNKLMENYSIKSVRIPFNMSNIVKQSIDAGKKEKYDIVTNTFLHFASLADQINRNSERSDMDIVFIDRYIYSIVGRAIAHNFKAHNLISIWNSYFSFDKHLFYFDICPQVAWRRRNLIGADPVTYWEAGLDIEKDKNKHDSFINYQSMVRNLSLELLPNTAIVIDGSREVEYRAKIIESVVGVNK
ncbi:hypothetical protein FHQ08_12215 [Lactobacillus sp. CC-MHH1034]|uniref:hypothetical protein n=1 Tax=Agrilactobacillus fermenti TaxID=2586909 RepID=UPI001E37AE13|nr:hypothetical protein [Agrilactobacillus fermenti]MCD2257451.1 hypothetical protein [Agrilactobacillus fermenti]